MLYESHPKLMLQVFLYCIGLALQLKHILIFWNVDTRWLTSNLSLNEIATVKHSGQYCNFFCLYTFTIHMLLDLFILCCSLFVRIYTFDKSVLVILYHSFSLPYFREVTFLCVHCTSLSVSRRVRLVYTIQVVPKQKIENKMRHFLLALATISLVSPSKSPKKGIIIPSWPRHFCFDFDAFDTVR